MQAVLLAAGESSRFFPYNTKHKCLVSLLGEPIILHTVRAIKKSGITDLVIITGKNDDFKNILGNGKKYGVKITYVIQEKATGAGDALLLAKKYIISDFFLVNSNHIEFEELKNAIDSKRTTNNKSIFLACKGSASSKFGKLKVKGDQVLELVEKPKNEEGFSDLRVIGVYFLNKEFLQVLSKTKPNHYRLEDGLDAFAKQGKVLVSVTNVQTLSLKYPWDLFEFKKYLLSKVRRSISKKANIAKNATIEGNVVIEDGVTISENAVIKGPAYIGRDAYVGTNALIRNESDIEAGSVVGGFMEVKNSLIMQFSKTHSGHLEDSIVGENSRIGAGLTTANVRLDRKNVQVRVGQEKIDSGRRDLGALIGSNTYLGARVVVMPGVIIGNNVNIGPSTTVMDNVESDTVFYTKFKEVVKKNKTR